MSGGTGADFFHRGTRLLGELRRGVATAAGVRRDGGEIGRVTDQVESAQGFPHFIIAGPNSGDVFARRDVRAIRQKPAIQRAGNLGAHFPFAPGRFDACEKRAGLHGLAGLEARTQGAGERRVDSGSFEHRDDDVVTGGVVEADQRERGVAADGEVRILQHGKQRGVELRGLIVLAHGPRGHGADGRFGARCEGDHLRIEILDGGIVLDDAVSHLREAVLNVVRIALGLQGVGELRVGERAAEPRGAPEKKRHQDEEQGESENDERPALAKRRATSWIGRRRTTQVNSLPRSSQDSKKKLQIPRRPDRRQHSG